MFSLVEEHRKRLNNIKTDTEEIGCEYGSWMYVAWVTYIGELSTLLKLQGLLPNVWPVIR